MKKKCLQDGQWSSVIEDISARVDLEATARAYGALRRKRKIRSAEELLHLALMYGPGQQSLRMTAGLTVDAGLPELSDKGVMGRLQHMGDWLAHILAVLLAEKLPKHAGPAEALDLAVVDGSLICSPGNGGKWRLHARFDPALGRFTDLVLGDARQAERSDRTRIGPGETIIQDRGYARVRDFAAVLGAGGDFITRLGWRSLRLLDADGRAIDLLGRLPQTDATAEWPVYLRGIARPLRLVIHRLPPEQAERSRKRVRRKSGKAGHRMDPRTATAAGYLMLLTSLPAERVPPERIIALYRQRWQVELGFKRLKSIGGIDRLPAADPALARTWLLAHLIAVVLTDQLACQLVGFPPSAV
jgi:transposase